MSFDELISILLWISYEKYDNEFTNDWKWSTGQLKKLGT